jgi:hypothetical protein
MGTAQHHNARQPVDDAVNSAVGNAEPSNALPPEVLSQLASQVTANVLQQLNVTSQDSRLPSQASDHAPPGAPSAATNGATRTPSVHSENSPSLSQRNVYTPPSPYRPQSEAVFTSPTSPTNAIPPMPNRYSPGEDRRVSSPLNLGSQPDEVRGERADRPTAPTGLPAEVTTLEKIWGPLFDGSCATPRLGQFLKGLALHLIEDYEPKFSLVITPSKLQKYYDVTKLSSEVYPWQQVFNDRTSSISRLFREVEAQHHLVQDRADQRPDIPGLTPDGFERWSTLMLLANPDQEFDRLQKALLDMPVCNYDDRKERFPKEMSRRLFPKVSDPTVREKMEKAITTHCNISPLNRWNSGSDAGSQPSHAGAKPHRADSMPASTAPHPSSVHCKGDSTASLSASQPGCAERGRQPYSNTPSEGAIEEEDDMPTPQPIERERKPYSAQPGGGRHYKDINRPSTPPADGRNAGGPASATLGRSSSIASGSGRPTDSSRTQPIPININQQHRQSTSSQGGGGGIGGGMDSYLIPEPANTNSSRHRANSLLSSHHPSGRVMRHRSPSTHIKPGASMSDYRRSEPDSSFGPSSYGAVPSASSSAIDPAESDSRRYRDRDRDRERDHYPATFDRHDAHRPSVYDTSIPRDRDRDRERERERERDRDRERDREPRPRYQSNAGYAADPRAPHYSSDEDYYRPVSAVAVAAPGLRIMPAVGACRVQEEVVEQEEEEEEEDTTDRDTIDDGLSVMDDQ